jgi:hypothetical protein
MAAAMNDSERLARLERIAAWRESENWPGLGPMDPGWRAARQRVQRDLAAILAEQREPEPRGAA